MNRKRYYPNRIPKRDSCAAAGMPLDQSTRDDFFIVRCTDCPEWWETHNKHPLSACRSACKHARIHAGHRAYVINVTKLKVSHRYEFVALSPDNEPPF